MNVDPMNYAQNIDYLLKFIAGLMSVGVTAVLTAIAMHFKWKKRVDDRLEADVGFQTKVLGNMENGAQLMTTHTRTLAYHNYKFTKVERQLRGQNQRMRELIKDHNDRHKAQMELPPLETEFDIPEMFIPTEEPK